MEALRIVCSKKTDFSLTADLLLDLCPYDGCCGCNEPTMIENELGT